MLVYRSRAKNKVLYGILGGREFFSNSQKYLERKITLECDGHVVSLPSRLQGLVFLNIASYMAGTNFWGTDREKRVSCVHCMKAGLWGGTFIELHIESQDEATYLR